MLEDIIAREKIECGLHRNGRFVGAWTPRHYAEHATKVEMLNKYANVGAEMIPRERQREMIASDYYFGGMHATRAGHLHPALYYKGLLEAAHRAGAILCAKVEAERIEKVANGWRVLTSKGPIECREVVVATNGYTGDLTPAAEAPRRAGGEPHHRDRGTARARQQADPRDALDRRHQARADLLPALARRQAA